MSGPNAYDELMAALEPGETVEAIVFGRFGWNGYSEPKPAPIPKEKQGKPMSLAKARPLMRGWSFCGGYGAPMAYATMVWTNRRIGNVATYDGSTWLTWTPRNPAAFLPELVGGS